MAGKRAWQFIIAATALLVLPLARAGAMQDYIQIHGFGGWGYGHTWNENNYQIGREDGSYNNSYFALNIAAVPYPQFSVNVQTFWKTSEEGLEMDFDYAFAEWSFFQWLKLRIGKVKSPFGLYSEVFDVGTLRPFYMLPQAIYGTPGYATDSYLGLGLTGEYPFMEGWRISYDLYGGKYILQTYLMDDPLNPGVEALVEPMVDDMVGAKIMLHLPIDGLSAGFSTYNGETEVYIGGTMPDYLSPMFKRNMNYLFLAEYVTDEITVRGEMLLNNPLEGDDIMDIYAYYLEASYLFLEHYQAAVIYDRQHREIELGLPLEPPTDHEEVAVGFNYWFTPGFVIKMSYHYIQGNLFASPQNLTLAVIEGMEERTDMFLLGTQFSF